MARNTDIALPAPRHAGTCALEHALATRRSIRDFAATALDRTQLAQLLWAAQGVTSADGLRTAPSAGALCPLETFLVAGTVADVAAGVYRYVPPRHALERVLGGDRRGPLAAAALAQACVASAAAAVLFAAVPARTTRKYGERGLRYIQLEAGHAAQNVLLQATALGLAAVPVGAFDDDAVAAALALPSRVVPLYLVALGVP